MITIYNIYTPWNNNFSPIIDSYLLFSFSRLASRCFPRYAARALFIRYFILAIAIVPFTVLMCSRVFLVWPKIYRSHYRRTVISDQRSFS